MENPLFQLPSRTAALAAAFAASTLLLISAPASVDARGAPDGFADLSDRVLPAVVNVSTTQVIRATRSERGERGGPEFKLPPGSPFEEFRDFLERQRPEGNA